MLLYKGGLNNCITNCLNCCRRTKLAEITTYGLGGYADWCYFPRTTYQAKRIYSFLKAQGKEIAVIGNGSNVLVSDGGFGGGVICLKEMSGIIKLGGNKICCLAGTKISTILKYCKKNGLSGIEYMYGIPASIGGAAFMNAGVGEYSISRNIVSVNYFGDICGKINAKQCNFTYKHSTMRDINGIILSVTLQLTAASEKEIIQRIEFFKRKRAHLPKGKSCGCVFKNGENYSSGELIDKAGLKGLRCGGAYVSYEHANFIISGGSSADEVKKLIYKVKQSVLLKFGIELQEEVVYIGDFNDFNG